MKYQDTVDYDTAITQTIAERQGNGSVDAWAVEPRRSPNPWTLITALEHDMMQRAAVLRTYSTMPTARNIAFQLEADAAELRRDAQLAQHAWDDGQILFRLTRTISVAMHSLLLASASYRALIAEPQAFARVPESAYSSIAPPKRGPGRPKAEHPLDRYKGQPWYPYLIKRKPGRPAKNEIQLTEEENIVQAKRQLRNVENEAMLARVRAGAPGKAAKVGELKSRSLLAKLTPEERRKRLKQF